LRLDSWRKIAITPVIDVQEPFVAVEKLGISEIGGNLGIENVKPSREGRL
jgi:hypothetical protein